VPSRSGTLELLTKRLVDVERQSALLSAEAACLRAAIDTVRAPASADPQGCEPGAVEDPGRAQQRRER
jgi:hypothetical protein